MMDLEKLGCQEVPEFEWFVEQPQTDLAFALRATLIALQEARAEARKDLKTGLPNERALFEHFEILKSENQPFAALFIDIDGFKLLNTEHGHEHCDGILASFSTALGQILRKEEDDIFLSRFGGDEFVVLARLQPGTGERDTKMSPQQRYDAFTAHLKDELTTNGVKFTVNSISHDITAKFGSLLCTPDMEATEVFDVTSRKMLVEKQT